MAEPSMPHRSPWQQLTAAYAKLLDVVLAPLYFHTLFSTPLDAEQAHELVDRLLRLSS